jgi:hypothetical protein
MCMEEIISYYAKIGEKEIVDMLRYILQNYNDNMEIEEYLSDTDCESDIVDMTDLTEEEIDIDIDENGFYYIT